jgi:hypothetical protein
VTYRCATGSSVQLFFPVSSDSKRLVAMFEPSLTIPEGVHDENIHGMGW